MQNNNNTTTTVKDGKKEVKKNSKKDTLLKELNSKVLNVKVKDGKKALTKEYIERKERKNTVTMVYVKSKDLFKVKFTKAQAQVLKNKGIINDVKEVSLTTLDTVKNAHSLPYIIQSIKKNDLFKIDVKEEEEV